MLPGKIDQPRDSGSVATAPRGPRERVARAGFRERKDRADVPRVTAPTKHPSPTRPSPTRRPVLPSALNAKRLPVHR